MPSATAIKERPILFNAEMVRAILSGRKTMTRRVIEPQPFRKPFQVHGSDPWLWFNDNPHYPKRGSLMSKVWKCPYGAAGDRLWVRETWRAWGFGDPHIEYKAGGVAFEGDSRCYTALAVDGPAAEKYMDTGKRSPEKWRPSIHMPRWASRLTLEVTGVKVERLQDISEHDAIAEGVIHEHRDNNGNCWQESSVSAFRKLWVSVYGQGSWDANPWTWAVTFKRIEADNNGEK